MRKLTVRLDDDEADLFASFCESNAITMQSCLHAAITFVNRLYEEHERTPVEDWPDNGSELGRGYIIQEARRLDASKRRRS